MVRYERLVTSSSGTFAPRGMRGLIYGPGFQSFSAALQKGFPVVLSHENHQLIFKAEAFNYTNHPNLDNPDMGPTDGNFGKVIGKGILYGSERQFRVQPSLRFLRTFHPFSETRSKRPGFFASAFCY